MRARWFQHKMLQLALVAALLLALMPTIGRVFATGSRAGDDGSAGPCPMSMDMSGMNNTSSRNHVDGMHDMPDMNHPQAIGGTAGRRTAPAGGNHDDCPYCPLLSALAGLAVLIVLLLPQCATRTIRTQRLSPRLAAFHPCGLGSRGPPLAAWHTTRLIALPTQWPSRRAANRC